MNAQPSIRDITRGIVAHLIAQAATDEERKQRILIAREEGLLSDTEAERLIAFLEVQAA
jgi:hypothetical protein